jgi:hypothetical protein
MAATTADRNTRSKKLLREVAYPVAAATVIPGGVLVALNAAGYLVNAADAAGLVVVGCSSDQTVDNSTGANGDKEAKVLKGSFHFANNGVNPVVQATVGRAPQIADNQTVRASGATNAITAGIVDRLEADGVWLWID